MAPRHPSNSMEIRVDLRSVSQRRIHVEVAVDREPGTAGDVEFFLPVWTPGSYLVREYSRHLAQVVAVDGGSGTRLPIEKSRKNRYRVSVPEDCRRVVLRYEVYAHSLTVREAWVGEEFAYWNGACVYLWPVGGDDLSARVRVDLPEGWQLFCGRPLEDGCRFELRDHDEAVDTPCLVMPDPNCVEFEVLDCPHRFVSAGLAGVDLPDSLIQDTRRVIEEAAAVFGGTLPLDAYTFLSLFNADGRGGLEHMDSSTLLAPRTTFAVRSEYQDFVSLIAHEYFHVWNVKRLKPRELMQFDYERENYTSMLWVAEGFTAYYDDHLCLRAGIYDPSEYLAVLCRHLGNAQRMPGRLVQSLREASYDAWIRFYRPDENTRNITQNYYSNGALAAICIDARIRSESGGERSLDDVMRGLFTTRLETGYTYDDVVTAASEAAEVDLRAEIAALVDGPFDPDFASVFSVYGLELEWKRSESPMLGVQFKPGTMTIATVFDGSAGWKAGLAPGDEILGVNGLRTRSGTWRKVFGETAEDGQNATLSLDRDGRLIDVEIEVRHNERASAKLVSRGDATEQQLKLREAWLGAASRSLA